MKPIRLIDTNFNLLGEIDDYESLIFTRRWHRAGGFELHININKQYAEHLRRGNIIILDKDNAGIIKYRECNSDEKGKGGEQLRIVGSTLSALIDLRITLPPAGQAYHKINNIAEAIMKEYVRFNCIEPDNTKRKIQRLEIAPIKGIGENLIYQTRHKQLIDEIEKISLVSGIGWNISLDYDNQKFIFDAFEGRDLTADQNINPPVIFSTDFDNIKAQRFIDSEIGYRTTAYVGGQGEGIDRRIIIAGAEPEGLKRYEVFVDARDIENDSELPERGRQKLAEMQLINTFESEILTEGPFEYKKDWDLGDITTVTNRRWGVINNLRIIEVKEIYEKEGYKLEATFGKPIPTLIDKIKREINTIAPELTR